MTTGAQNNTGQWFKLLNAEMDGTSDRSCIITAASIIDHLLLEFIRARLVPNSSGQDSLLDGPNAPIGTFSSRIDIAFRVGLISAQVARDLHLIRRLRNDVAHSIAARTFDDPGVADKVLHLVRSLNVAGRGASLLKEPYEGTRGTFVLCAILIISGLDFQVRESSSIPALLTDPVYTATYAD